MCFHLTCVNLWKRPAACWSRIVTGHPARSHSLDRLIRDQGMFNMIVKSSDWAESRDSIPAERVFEHTSKDLEARFKPNAQPDFPSLLGLPTIFVKEHF